MQKAGQCLFAGSRFALKGCKLEVRRYYLGLQKKLAPICIDTDNLHGHRGVRGEVLRILADCS